MASAVPPIPVIPDGRPKWERPLCLVDNPGDGQFKVVEETVKELIKVRDPVVVVSIVGPYRSGKSYLMNRLAGYKKGFELGSTIQAKTKGIWVWCLPHPDKSDHQLLLLDTEGMGDVEKVAGSKNDIMLFLLTTLLSSCLIYNSRGTIDGEAVDKLKFVSELAEKFKISKSSQTAEEDDQLLGQYFPKFIWVVRDFTLELKINGNVVTADEYLANCLALKKGSNKSVNEYNMARRCIAQYFPDRKCFPLPPPVTDVKLFSQLADITAASIEVSFLQQYKLLYDHVMGVIPAKSIGGIVMNGQQFVSLVTLYTPDIVDGKIPSIESVVIQTATEVNRSIVADSIRNYTVDMATLPLPSNDELSLMSHHESCVTKVKDELKSRCINLNQGEEEVVTQLMEQINKEFEAVKEKNERLSLDKCRQLLTKQMSSVRSKVDNEDYHKAGGYSQYEKDFGEACRQYLSTPNKGVMATKALQETVTNLSATAKAIMIVDKALSDENKKKEEQRLKEKVEELERENMKRKQQESERILAEQQRRQQEFELVMNDRFEQQNRRHSQEMRRLVSVLSMERDRLKKQGITEDADNMEDLIESINSAESKREEQPTTRQQSLPYDKRSREPLYFIHQW